MQLTDRDIQILKKVNECLWLSTSQIKRCFFADTTTRAVSKRLRLLVDAKWLSCERASSTDEYFYKLGSQGRDVLTEKVGIDSEGIRIARQLPTQLKHFSTINDLRWYFELAIQKESGALEFFFVDRELKSLLADSAIIPDVLVSFTIGESGQMKKYIVAVEYDAGTENPQYFGRDKVKRYSETFRDGKLISGAPDLRVVVFADTRARIVQLIRYSMKFLRKDRIFLFASLEDLSKGFGLRDYIFVNPQQSNVTSLYSLIE
jgi:hypothetical protein